MNEKELRAKIGIGPTELVDGSSGLVDIFAVKGGRITYGFLATGKMTSETIDEFLARFKSAAK